MAVNAQHVKQNAFKTRKNYDAKDFALCAVYTTMPKYPVIGGFCINCYAKCHEGNWHEGCEKVGEVFRIVEKHAEKIFMDTIFKDVERVVKTKPRQIGFINGSSYVLGSTVDLHGEAISLISARGLKPFVDPFYIPFCEMYPDYLLALEHFKPIPGTEIIIESTANGTQQKPFFSLFSRSFRPWGSNLIYVDFSQKKK